MTATKYRIYLGLLILMLMPMMSIAAQDGDPTIDRIALSDLGFASQSLSSPYEEISYLFHLPAHWAADSDTRLQLNIQSLADNSFNGILQVSMNGIELESTSVDWEGVNPIRLSLTDAALQSQRADGLHELQIVLLDAPGCESQDINVVVENSSSLLVSYTEQPVALDLGLLPYPIYQQTVAANTAILVVPDEASEAEMQAALTTAASFGAQTGGALSMELLPEGDVSDDLLAENHVIFVGSSESFALLEDVEFPLSGDDLADAESGVLQMAVSPWNESLAVLYIGGSSDDAIIKAGQALGSNTLLTGDDPELAFVTGISDSGISFSQPLLQGGAFADSDYEVQTFSDVGVNVQRYEFFVPRDAQLDIGGSTFDLVFSHSTLLDYNASGITLRLNGVPVNTIRLDNDTAQLSQVSTSLPLSLLQVGVNELTIETNLEARNSCYDTRSDDMWLTVWPESALNLNFATEESLGVATLTRSRVDNYAQLFTFDSRMVPTAFVLPADDTSAWTQAGRMAFAFGQNRVDNVGSVTVAYGEVGEAIENHNLIVIGTQDNLPAMGDLTLALDDAELDGVFGGDTEGRALGFLELFTSPWDENRVGLVVTSSNTDGLSSAVNTLLDGSEEALEGNLVVVENERTVTLNTGVEASADEEPAVVDEEPTAAQAADTPTVEPLDMSWIPIVVGISSVLIVIIILIVIFTGARKPS
jgi:hypothetical protein